VRSDLLAQALKLPPIERLELIEALWDTLSPADLPVTDEERGILDQRMSEMKATPDDERPWSEVKARLDKSRH